MRCVFLKKQGFDIKEIPIPEIAADDLLIRTDSTGICEGDVYIYTQREELIRDLRLGHEGSGIVEKTGSRVTSFSPGDRVTSFANTGAFCEYFIAKENELVRLPDSIDFEWALGEPLACCIHASKRFGIVRDRRIAVLGCGFMGLICLQIAKYHGAAFILAVDPIRERVHLAANLGANEYLYEDIPSAIYKFNSSFDVVIEASGTQAALTLAGDLYVNHGRIITIGYHQSNGGMRQINMKQWNYKAIDVVNGHIRNENEKFNAMKAAVNLLREEKISTKGLVSVFPFSEINEAFESLRKREQGLIKGVVKVRE